LGIGDWGLGIGDWGLGIGPNPQSPIKDSYFSNYFTLLKKYIIIYITKNTYKLIKGKNILYF